MIAQKELFLISSKSKSQTGIYKSGGNAAFNNDSDDKVRNLNLEFGAEEPSLNLNKNRKSKLNRSGQRF